MIQGGKRHILLILTVAMAATAAVLAVSALFADPVGNTRLDATQFFESKTANATSWRLPKKLRDSAAQGLPIRVWVNGRKAHESPSVELLGASAEESYRVKAGTVLYVTDSLRAKMATDAVVVAADYPAKVQRWSETAASAALILSLFLLLSRFKVNEAKVSAPSHHRLVTLDSLRGIAATVVMLVHAGMQFIPGSWLYDITPSPGWEQAPALATIIRDTPLAFFLNGAMMVHLFWILSGIVLSAPLLRSNSQQQIAKSAAKRYFRLVPFAALTILASYFLCATSGYFVTEFNERTKFGASALAPLVSPDLTTAVQEALLFGQSYNPPLWTIKLEFFGSLFLFSLLACTLPLMRRHLVWVGLLLFFLAFKEVTYLADFIAGLLLADFIVKNGKVKSLGTASSIVLATAAWILASAVPGWLTALVGPLSFGHTVVFQFLPACIFIILALRSELISSFLRLRPFVWLGERSFAIYVVHALTIQAVGQGVAVACLRLGLPIFTSSAIGFVAFLAFTLWISDWLTKWIDMPSTHFANAVGRWFAGESKATDATKATSV